MRVIGHSPFPELKGDIVKAVKRLYLEHGSGNQITLQQIQGALGYDVPRSTLQNNLNRCISEGSVKRIVLSGKEHRQAYSYRIP